MDPVLRATLTSWDLRIEVILVLALAGAIFYSGWRRLRARTLTHKRHTPWQVGAAWRPVLYLGSLVLLGITLMSPIDVLSAQLFTMHMVQHIFLVMIVPPLLLLTNPFPIMLWGLPRNARLSAGHLFSGESRFRYYLARLTGPGIVWFAFVIVYWGWHDPNAYTLALENALIHDLEHLTFFAVSMLFWWHVTAAAPHIHKRLPPFGRFVYVLAAIPPNMLAGVAIAFARGPIYSYYEAMPRLWGLSVMEDQQIAGVLMWVPGSMMYMIAALVLVGRYLQEEEKKPPLPLSTRAADETQAAPVLKK